MKDKKIYAGRINSLELYRGIALACVIFFHTAIYNFGGLPSVDLANPSILVTVIGLMGLWGGIFILLSLVTSTLSILRRQESQDQRSGTPRYIVLASMLYLLLHVALSSIFGRWELSTSTASSQMTLTAELLRNQAVSFPGASIFFDGSVLSTIGLNLLFIGSIVYFLFRQPSKNNEKRAYTVLGALGIIFLVASFFRVLFYPMINEALTSQNYLVATVLGALAGPPYPLISYALYGIIGSIVGVMVYYGRLNSIRRIIFPLGLAALVLGVIGCMSQPITFNKPDLFGQWKTIAELGVFTLILTFALGVVQPRENGMKPWTIFMWFSRISLTIYMLETTMSEILRHAWFVLFPGWNLSIPGTLLFSAFNILWWLAIAYLWSKADFKYSLEYFWVKLFRRLGKRSSKLDELQTI